MTLGFNPWVGKIPWRSKWPHTPVFSPEKSHKWRSLVGYSPWSHKELDRTYDWASTYPCNHHQENYQNVPLNLLTWKAELLIYHHVSWNCLTQCLFVKRVQNSKNRFLNESKDGLMINQGSIYIQTGCCNHSLLWLSRYIYIPKFFLKLFVILKQNKISMWRYNIEVDLRILCSLCVYMCICVYVCVCLLNLPLIQNSSLSPFYCTVLGLIHSILVVQVSLPIQLYLEYFSYCWEEGTQCNLRIIHFTQYILKQTHRS